MTPYIFWNIFIYIVIFLRTEIHIQRQVIMVHTHSSLAPDADFRIRICVSVCIYRSAIVNVGRHFASFSSHLVPCRLWCAIQVMRMGRNCLYPLSHLTATYPVYFECLPLSCALTTLETGFSLCDTITKLRTFRNHSLLYLRFLEFINIPT